MPRCAGPADAEELESNQRHPAQKADDLPIDANGTMHDRAAQGEGGSRSRRQSPPRRLHGERAGNKGMVNSPVGSTISSVYGWWRSRREETHRLGGPGLFEIGRGAGLVALCFESPGPTEKRRAYGDGRSAMPKLRAPSEATSQRQLSVRLANRGRTQHEEEAADNRDPRKPDDRHDEP
jgi:hypothetical protein